MNCKPNYLSVMSYSRQVPIDPLTVPIWEGTPTSKSFLDYSNHGYWSLPGWSILDLNEGSLSETSGLTTQDRQQIVYGTPGIPPTIRISPTHFAPDPINPGINWNGNAAPPSGIAIMDINQLSSFAGCPATPTQIEKGYDDWLIMTLKFLDDADSRDGVGGDPRKLPELTSEILTAFRAELNQFVGPDSPNRNGSSVYVLNTTVPVRFELRDINGSFVKNADVSFIAKQISGNVSGTHLEPVNVTLVPSVGDHFKYDNIKNQYFYNWDTKNLIEGEYGLQFIANANSTKESLLQGIGEVDISVKVGLKKP